jgi:hypothetical protein
MNTIARIRFHIAMYGAAGAGDDVCGGLPGGVLREDRTPGPR